MTNLIIFLVLLLRFCCRMSSAASGSDQTTAGISPHRRLDTLADFTIGETVTMDIDSTNKQLWAVDMKFVYWGGIADTIVTVLDWDCTSILPPGLISPAENALTFGENDFTVHLDVNFEGSQNPGTGIWNPDPDGMGGDLTFCVRVELFYDGVFVNFAATQTTITVGTSGDFLVFQEETTVRSAVGLAATSQVNIAYEVSVYPCDVSAQPLDLAPVFSPGKAIRLCASLSDSDANQNVYVSNVESLSYHSGDPSLAEMVIVVDGVPQNQLVLVDCTQVAGGKHTHLVLWQLQEHTNSSPLPFNSLSHGVYCFGELLPR